TAEIRVGRGRVRVQDGDVHDSPDAGPGCRVEQDLAVGHRGLPGGAAMREPHPVRAVQGVAAGHIPGESIGVAEVERVRVDIRAGRGTLGMAGERAYPVPGRAQLAGDGRARITECAGDDIGLHQAPSTLLDAVSSW